MVHHRRGNTHSSWARQHAVLSVRESIEYHAYKATIPARHSRAVYGVHVSHEAGARASRTRCLSSLHARKGNAVLSPSLSARQRCCSVVDARCLLHDRSLAPCCCATTAAAGHARRVCEPSGASEDVTAVAARQKHRTAKRRADMDDGDCGVHSKSAFALASHRLYRHSTPETPRSACHSELRSCWHAVVACMISTWIERKTLRSTGRTRTGPH